MGRKREPMDPAKKNIVSELIKTYDIKTAKDIQEALKDLLGETLQDMLEAEMNEHLGYEKYSRDAESLKYWLSVFNELKNRGLKDIMILCTDGLTGIKESINVAFPNTEYQRCIVHQVRNTLKYVSYKDKREFATDLKSIYLSGCEEQARQSLDAVSEKWSEKYPNSLKSWYTNWDCITPIFKFLPETRRVIYTTNAIESLNAQFKRLNRNRSVFPTKSSLEKALFLSVEKISKKWTHPIRNWGSIFGELSIMFEERISY